MSTSLSKIRAKLQQLENARSGNSFQGDGLTYPFWNMNENSTAVVRFLPDGNDENPFFWVEKQVIKLPFAGIKGKDESNEVIVQVPCVEMFGESCPILAEVRPMFSDSSLEDLARKYWKKRSYIFQGFVQESPFVEENAPENPIRRFIISPQLFNIIKSALMDPDLEELPTDYVNGVDFRITKTKKGNFFDYSTSKYSRKETSLTEEQLEAIETHGLVDLSTYLPEKPGPEELSVIYEMFQASLEGELYDPEKWAKYYRPWGLDYAGPSDSKTNSSSNEEAKPEKAVKTETAKAEFDADAAGDMPWKEDDKESVSTTEKSVNDILAKVRNRNI